MGIFGCNWPLLQKLNRNGFSSVRKELFSNAVCLLNECFSRGKFIFINFNNFATISDSVGGGRCIFWTEDSIGNAIGVWLCCFVIEQAFEVTSYFRLSKLYYEFEDPWFVWNSLNSKDGRTNSVNTGQYLLQVWSSSWCFPDSLIKESDLTFKYGRIQGKFNFKEVWGITFKLDMSSYL